MRIADWLPWESHRKVTPAEPRCSHMMFRVVSRRRMPSIGDPGLSPDTNVWYSGYDEVVEQCLSCCGATVTRYSLERPEETLGASQARTVGSRPIDAEWEDLRDPRAVVRALAPAAATLPLGLQLLDTWPMETWGPRPDPTER